MRTSRRRTRRPGRPSSERAPGDEARRLERDKVKSEAVPNLSLRDLALRAASKALFS